MRLHLRLSDSAEQLILSLTEQLHVSPREAVLDSLALYNLAIKEMLQGRRLGIQNSEGQFMAITTPTLHTLSEKVAQGEFVADVSMEKTA